MKDYKLKLGSYTPHYTGLAVGLVVPVYYESMKGNLI